MARVIFIEPNVLANPSVRVMPTLYKTLWLYLLTSVDQCGVWQVDWEVASIVIGGEIDQEQARKFFLETEDGSANPKAIEFDRGRKWFLPKFLEFQSPKGLFSNAPWAISVRKKAEKHGICLQTMMPFECKNEPLSKPLKEPLDQPYRTGQGQDMDNEEYNSSQLLPINPRGVQGGIDFCDDYQSQAVLYRDFLQAYGDFGRAPKPGAIEQSLLDAVRRLQSIQPDATIPECCAFLIAQARINCESDIEKRQTKRLNPETWLQNRVYESDLSKIKQAKKSSSLDRLDAAIEAMKRKHKEEQSQ